MPSILGGNFSKLSNMQRNEKCFFSYSRSATYPFSCMSDKTTKHFVDDATQTDFQAKNKLLIAEELFGNNDDMILNQESKMIYNLALKYINKFHELLNSELGNFYKNYEAGETFVCPNVPNYSYAVRLPFNSSSKSHNKISQSNITPDIKLDHQSTGLNLLDCKIQNILRSMALKQNIVSEKKSEPSDISMRELEISQNVPNKIIKKNVKFQERSRQVRKKSNFVQTSFNVVAIEPCIDLLEYARSKEQIKKLNSIPAVETIRPILPSSSVRSFTTKKVVKMFDSISQDSKNCNKYDSNEDSDESVIFDDEQFEQYTNKLKNKQRSMKDVHVYSHPDIKKNLLINENANPLKQNQKDFNNINQETFGLFPNRDEIKPEVIDVLEREKSMRNQMFRGQRQLDLEIHPDSKTGLERGSPSTVNKKTFPSYSDVKIHTQNLK